MWIHVVALVALGLVGWSTALAMRAPSWPAGFAEPPQPPGCKGVVQFSLGLLRNAAPNYAHATAAVALRDGRLRAFWYEGERETGPDVAIFTAVFDGTRWSVPRAVIDAPRTGAAVGRHTKTVGNPTVYRDAAGDLVLVYVSVGVGGWSGSALNLMRSRDDGDTWSGPRRLNTTPTFNFGTLVRSPAVPMQGGATLLPAYQEFMRRFAEVYLLDGNGDVIARRRVGVGQSGIQPHVIVFDRQRAIAFQRTRGVPTAMVSLTADAGWSWTTRATSPIPNFDTPMTGARLDTGELLLVYNAPALAGGVGPLTVAVSSDEGVSWRAINTVTPSRPGRRMTYPSLTVTPDGTYHLLFTNAFETGSELVHLRFNRDWVAAVGGPACR